MVVAIEVVESATSPPPVPVVDMGEERVVTETAAPQMGSESQVRTGLGDDDMVMMPTDQGAAPPPQARDYKVVALEMPKSPAVVTAPTTEGAEETPTFGT
jgi:hypothetical protein